MGDKVSIRRGTETETRVGRIWLWFVWQCSCGGIGRYLNETAMKLGSERHADSHRKRKAKK